LETGEKGKDEQEGGRGVEQGEKGKEEQGEKGKLEQGEKGKVEQEGGRGAEQLNWNSIVISGCGLFPGRYFYPE
jgi:hypothetical protein